MDWIWEVGKLVLATGLGFAGGQGAVLLDRKRKAADAEASKTADFEVKWEAGDTWSIKNVGNAPAADLAYELEEFQPAQSNFPASLAVDEKGTFMGIRRGSPQLVITWTSHRGESLGPIKRFIPPRQS
ncbi:hypothetical protein GU243_06150 [Pseudarthrobacter psychrotolerans]|uniref:Uncharacterized protein n=1 Tax=Pseudarthrobacter psychrotolerans TaxID=2697569 RepID=A0A6P1NLJ8_9MICC|nr:hypothetical protein [Pseudarthrobacter psychrotolerans]QHK19394.1 hypothetical protein GU243_06150 [Pseudarthrobacter psychrotolerans]